MGYKRAEWKSGLTYRQTCEQCKSVVVYNDTNLGYRPWFADGFVYCPVCNKPIRHNEKYAENNNNNININIQTDKQTDKNNHLDLFCPKCGRKYSDEDNYCSKCGNK